MAHTDYNELLARYFSGEATAEERRQIEMWRQAAAENQRAFAEFESLWQRAAEKAPPTPNVDQAWQELSAQLGLPAEKLPANLAALPKAQAPARAFYWGDRYVWAAAAAILLAFAAILYQYLSYANALQTAGAAYGRRESIELPDGSLAELNSGSNIQFYKNFSDTLRAVMLSGEAYFEVKAEARPFVVHTGHAQVKVLGTKFGVWARNEKTRVTVREGRVSLAALNAPQAAVVLTANQMSVCGRDSAPEPPRAANAGDMLAWREGKIVFDQTPLREVIGELERVYDVSIALSDPALGRMTITGAFHNKPLEAVLASICLTLDVQYARRGGKYFITP